MTDTSGQPDYLRHLAQESARFRAALTEAPSSARVPSCPDWDAVDLLWHLGEVQWFWGEIVREGVTEHSGTRALEVVRPAGRAQVEAFYDEASRGLVDALTTTPPETAAWTWSSEQSVGFIRRRQAHEALIHRLDAELTAGNRTSMDPTLSADGVDEVLRIMYGGAPPWGVFTASPARTVRVTATDTGGSWVLTLGRFVGIDPDDDTPIDDADLRVAPRDLGGETAASVRGTAADLDCWLWRRPPVGDIERSGDVGVLAALDEILAPGIS
ncbi:MAG: hypothetical protein QOI54_2424 [Actinomycetota bacterium]|jgi:uncharacterized protein (TIGR03083 family)|nr:hypothetical protein [Actinomycetota bacterium]